MRIAMVSTEAGSGGAARAMQRLAHGLRGRGHVVDVLVSTDIHASDHEISVRPLKQDSLRDRYSAVAATSFDHAYVASRRTLVSNTSFSTQVCGYDLASLRLLSTYDVVNVHWTGSMMSPLALGNLIDLGIPTFFTLHDMAHFTGGCHYSAGCRGYEADCEPCHQVQPDELGLVGHSLRLKRLRYGRPNSHAISPSSWLATKADASRVFGAPAHVISNGLETNIFRLRDRTRLRQEWGLADDACAILFGVYDNGERRKGYEELVEVLKRCAQDPIFAEHARNDRIRFISFGKSQVDLEDLGIPFVDLGWVNDDEFLSEIYNAADLCILPSSEDNQPNVMLEAMACGTPVVAFNIGGIPENIVNGETGILVDPFDLDEMAQAVVALVNDRERSVRIGEAAAAFVETLTLDRQAQAYERVFQDLVSTTGWTKQSYKESDLSRDEEGRRFVRAPFILDPYVETKPIGPILADQIDALSQELSQVKENRDELHGQLIAITSELTAVTANRDGLYQQLVAVNEHSAARDAELALLKDKLLNRIILKIRARIQARSKR